MEVYSGIVRSSFPLPCNSTASSNPDNREHGEIWGRLDVMGKSGILEHKSGNIS